MNGNDTEKMTQTTQSTVKQDLLSAACSAADAIVTSVAGTKLFQRAVHAIGTKYPDALRTEGFKSIVGTGICSKKLLTGDFIPSLAQALDRLWAKEAVETEEDGAADEEAVVTPVAEEAIPVMAVATSAEEVEDDCDEEESDSFAGMNLSGLEFIDVKAQPEEYNALLEQERDGLIRIVTRYRRSFLSRLIQSQGDVQEYYSVLKNHLLSYKGVKSRVSWGNESFNKGRTYLAKINAKSKTLYLYLALDPTVVSALEDGKYNIVDMSSKKKYENVPVLIKIKGSRKLKHALELIDLLCRDNLQLPEVKNFEEQDYTLPYRTTEELVESGEVKMLVAGMVISEPTTGSSVDVPSVESSESR